MSLNPPKVPAIPPKRVRFPKTGEVIEWCGHEFRIGQHLADGSFGHVYECTDEWGNNLVAKVLKPTGSYPAVKANWERELDNLTRFRHPNITYVHAAFERQDTFFIIVERCYLTFEEFLTILPGTGEPWLLDAASDILQPLEFIHRTGYVHKDLHAGNVFVAEVPNRNDPDALPEWIFKIGDLGLSKQACDIHQTGTLMAQWMLPPECLDTAQFGTIGKHVDIYHAGLLLLSLLLKTSPTFAPDEIVAGKPRETAESLSSAYGPVIAKALRRHVNARTQSAIELWRELQSVSL